MAKLVIEYCERCKKQSILYETEEGEKLCDDCIGTDYFICSECQLPCHKYFHLEDDAEFLCPECHFKLYELNKA